MTFVGASAGESRPIWRRVLHAVLIGAGVVVGLIAGLVLLLQFDAVGTRVARTVVRMVAPDSLDVSIERVSGSWLGSLSLAGLTITEPAGDTVLSIDTLRADYRLLPLFRRRVALGELYVAEPVLDLVRRPDGSTGIEGWPAAPDTAPPAQGGWRFSVDDARITRAAGTLTTPLEPRRADDRLHSGGHGDGTDVADAGKVAFEWSDVDVAIRDLSIAGDVTAFLDSAVGRLDVPTLPPDAAVGPLDFLVAGNVVNGVVAVDTVRLVGPRSLVAGGGTFALPDSSGAPVALDFRLRIDSLPLAIVHAVLGNPPDADARLNATAEVGGTTALLTASIEAETTDGGTVSGTAAFAPPGRGAARYRADLTIGSLDPAVLTGDSALAGAIDGTLLVDLEGPANDALVGSASASLHRFTMGPAALRSVSFASTWTDGEAAVDLAIEGDDIAANLAGTIRPFGGSPSYALRGPVRLTLPGDTAAIGRIAGIINATGEGIDPDSAHASVHVDFSQLDILDVSLEDGRIDANLDDGRVAFTAHASDARSGRIDVNGTVTFGQMIGFTVDRATVRDFDIAALLGDTVPSHLDAVVTASGIIGQLERTQADIELAVRDARYGRVLIDTTVVDAHLAGGRLRATGRALSNAGQAVFELTALPFADVPSWEVASLRFSDLDLGKLTDDTSFSSSLTGRASGTGSGTALEALVLDLDATLDSSRINRQHVTSGEAHIRLRDAVSDIEAGFVFADSGSIRVAATGRPFAERPTFDIETGEFRALDPFALTGPSGTQSASSASLNGSFTATIDGTDPRTMLSAGEIRLDRSRINRETVTDGVIDWTLRDAHLDADVAIEFETGRLTADAGVTFGESETSYVLDAMLRSARPGRLAGLDTLGGFVDATLSVEGRGTSLASMDTRIRAVADSAIFGDVQIDTLRVALRLANGIATIDTLIVRSNFADVNGGGSMPVSDSASAVRADLTIDGTIRSLDPVRRWIGVEPIGIGTGELHIAVTGSTDSLRLDATANASALLLGGNRLIGLEAAVQGRLENGLHLAAATGHVELDRLDLGGFEVRLSRLDGQWDGDELAMEGEATLDDRRDATFAMRIDPRPGTARADIEQFDFRVDQDNWQLTGQPVLSWADGIRIDSLRLQAGGQVIAVNGLLDMDGRSDMTVRVEQLRIGSVADLLGYDRLEGTLTASVDLQGLAAAPRLTAGIDARLEWQNGQQSSVIASVTYDSLRLDLDAAIRTDQGGAVTVAGGLPIDLALTRTAEGDTTTIAAAAPGSVDLAIRADSFAVEWIEPFLDRETARDFAGRLQIDARVTGTQDDPQLSGFMRLANGGVYVPGLGVNYRDAAMVVSFDGNVARIDSAYARTADGTINIGGTISMPRLSLGEFDINARLDDFRAIYTDMYRVSASGTAAISGTTAEPRLAGDLELVQTDIYLDDAISSGASVQPVELTDEQIRELEEYFGQPIRRPERDASAFYEALTIDLDVSMSRDTWVRQRANPQIEIQLSGDIEVTKEPQDSLRLNGTIQAISRRSYVEQFGRRFIIEQGVVELRGTPMQAEVDIRAAYTVPSVRNPGQPEATITLDLDGTLSNLSLELGSEPEMENADIVSYLATGRPAGRSLDLDNSGSGGTALGSFGGDIALSQVTGLIEGLAGEGVGLDVIEIQPDGLRGATLIAGRFVSPRVYVGFKQPIGRDQDDPDGRSDFERTEVELEYQALRWLLLNMEASNSAVSFLLRFRHAY